MTPSTIWEIETATPKGNWYGAEGEKFLFGDFSALRPKMIDLNRDCLITFDDPQNASHLTLRNDYAKIAKNASRYWDMWIHRDSDREYWIATGDWPLAGTNWIPDLQDTSFTRIGRGTGDTSHLPERTLVSTATDVLSADNFGQLPYYVSYNAGKASVGRKLLHSALRRTVTVVLGSGHKPDPVPRETLIALDSIKNLPDNWDSDGASRIDEATVVKAEQLIRQAFLTSPRRLNPPSIAPGFGGMIVAEWSGPAGTELILDIPAGDEPPGFLLVEVSPEGDELETDDRLGHAWSIQDLIARLIPD